MQTGRAILAAGIIVAATGGATAWVIQPRYTLVNAGAGLTVRLDRNSGDMIGCERLQCAPIVHGETAIKPVDKWAEFKPVQ